MFHSIVEAVFYHSKKAPDKLALVDDTNEVTYRQYAELIKKYAVVLGNIGVSKYSMVILEAEQTIDYLALELAIQLLGAIFVPLEHNCSESKISELSDYLNATVIITDKKINTARKVFDYNFFRTAQTSLELSKNFEFPNMADISEILFSTGTTGKEKGIALTHGNDLSLAENVIFGVCMKRDNVELIPSPMNHSHGLRRYYANMYNGSTVILLGSVMNIKRLFYCLDNYGVTAIDLVPAAMSVILKLTRNKLGEYKDQLQYIQFGAAPMSEDDKNTICSILPNTRMYNFYGSTESGCTFIYDFNVPNRKKNCIGKPTHNVTAILTDERRNIVNKGIDASGLLATTGSMNMLGYWRDSDETKKVLQNGVIYSNDMVRFDANGDAILLGRKGDVINVGGNKVSPDEIETVAKRMEIIADCGCVPVEDSAKGQVPKLYVQLKSGAEFDPVEIRTFLSKYLEPYKVPIYIERIDKIPRSFNGKLLRKILVN